MEFHWPSTLRDVIVFCVGTLGIAWYYICILVIGAKPLAGKAPGSSFRQFMSLSITTISVSLATYVGMILGLRSVSDEIQKGVARANAMAGAATAAATAAAAPLREAAQVANPNALQWGAAILYILSLVLALVLWWRGGDDTDPAISKLGQSLLGLIGGALSVLLNTNP